MNPVFLNGLHSVPAAELIIKSDGTILASAQKGMQPGDFTGVNVIKLDVEEKQVSCEVITSAVLSNGVITLTAGSTTLTYTVATGAYAAS